MTLSQTRRGPPHQVTSACRCCETTSRLHWALRCSHPTGGGETARQNVGPPAPAALGRIDLAEHLGANAADMERRK
eukprot:7938561-Pyramimonas_sp.AAC.1